MSRSRHYCTQCGAKRYACYMYKIRVYVSKQDYWVCFKCMRDSLCDNDIVHRPSISMERQMVMSGRDS